MLDGLLDADIVIEQIDEHVGGWCDSGHKAPAQFRRAGPESTEEPTRFFHFRSASVNGIYCEPCLIVANHLANLKKQGKL